MSKTSNEVSHVKDEVLSRLRRIAWAETNDMLTKAIKDLKASDTWKQNKKLQQWFTRTWLTQLQVM